MNTPFRFGWRLLLAAAFGLLGTLPAPAAKVTLPNGDQIAFDGAYYDFRDAAGVQMIKMWIPPGLDTIRGVLISGHGGGGGDSRNFARDENVRALAMRLGFAVAGLHNFPGRSVYEQGAAVFFRALEEFAQLGGHPEIAHLPFVIYGSSNGGATAYGFVNHAPERAICFVANVSGGGNPEIPVDAALGVPGVFVMGQFDALVQQRGLDRVAAIMQYARERGARWSWAVELKGHEDGCSFDIYMKLVEQAVAARYPASADPRAGLVQLQDLPEESGWLVDQQSWADGLVRVAPWAEYSGAKAAAGWVLNQDLAYVYRSLATHHPPFTIRVREFDRTFNPHTDPGTMFSLGGPVARPGDQVTVEADLRGIPEWQSLEFFNGAVPLGRVDAGQEPRIQVTLDGRSLVYCLTALATDRQGRRHTCPPLHFFVEDPSRPWNRPARLPVFAAPKTNRGAPPPAPGSSFAAAEPSDGVLVAYGLPADQEEQFSATDGQLAPFWSRIDAERDSLLLTPRDHASAGAAFNRVRSHECNVRVRAAYGADGLYLLWEVNDDNDVPWPNEFAGTENEQFYHNFDAVDMLLDRLPLAEMIRPENRGLFLTRHFALTGTTRQYQVACGTADTPPAGLVRSLGDPWDFHGTYLTFAQARQHYGLEIEILRPAHFQKAQEWFIPWSEVGGGFPEQPPAATRFCFSAGFNDRDEGEHFPPGVTSSGGSVQASNALRWIDRADPWSASPDRDPPPFHWGEIELGPLLP